VATKEESSTGKIIQSWVPADLAAELKRHAEDERRSVSAVIRDAVEDAVRPAEESDD
jgi:hypothetical protein